jgi:hypothetical protein
MRTLIFLVLLCNVALADGPAITGAEVIVIEGSPPPPKVKAKPKKRYFGTGDKWDNIFLRPAPEYSDSAIEHDAWEVAWMLLDIDESGRVTRTKFLKHPGHDLEKIAVRTALALQFEPAIAQDGKPARSYVIWPIEWPSYWWLVSRTGLATGIPDTSHVPCRGSGPLHLNSAHPVYRDCAPPDLHLANTEAWQTR